MDLVQEIARRYREHELSSLAAALSFRVLVALIPLAIFAAAAGAIAASRLDAGDHGGRLADAAMEPLSEEAATALEAEIEEMRTTRAAWPLLLGLAGTLWLGSMAAGTAFDALNRIHGVGNRRAARRGGLMAPALTLATGVLLTAAFGVLFGVEWFRQEIAAAPGIGRFGAILVWAGGGFVAFGLALTGVMLLYGAGAGRSRRPTAGGLGFAGAWLVSASVFAACLPRVGSWNTYGILGALLLVAGWTFATSLTFLLGAELDAALLTRRERGSGGPRRPARARPFEHLPELALQPERRAAIPYRDNAALLPVGRPRMGDV